MNSQDLLLASQILLYLTGIFSVEKHEKRHTFLLDLAPKTRYYIRISVLPENLSLIEIKKELILANIDIANIYAIN